MAHRASHADSHSPEAGDWVVVATVLLLYIGLTMVWTMGNPVIFCYRTVLKPLVLKPLVRWRILRQVEARKRVEGEGDAHFEKTQKDALHDGFSHDAENNHQGVFLFICVARNRPGGTYLYVLV